MPEIRQGRYISITEGQLDGMVICLIQTILLAVTASGPDPMFGYISLIGMAISASLGLSCAVPRIRRYLLRENDRTMWMAAYSLPAWNLTRAPEMRDWVATHLTHDVTIWSVWDHRLHNDRVTSIIRFGSPADLMYFKLAWS